VAIQSGASINSSEWCFNQHFRVVDDGAFCLRLTGEVDILIGTHALLSGDVKFPALGLVVVDEEHRFGVTQVRPLLTIYSISRSVYLPTTR
jgi:hypothetical protein